MTESVAAAGGGGFTLLENDKSRRYPYSTIDLYARACTTVVSKLKLFIYIGNLSTDLTDVKITIDVYTTRARKFKRDSYIIIIIWAPML